jgi:hypothetical protein
MDKYCVFALNITIEFGYNPNDTHIRKDNAAHKTTQFK